MKRMRSTYVPFAIKNRALLACILYVSYHRRSVNTTDPAEAAKCSLKTEHYRLACIELTKNAISVEERPALQTIAMALLLSSEAVSLLSLSSRRLSLGKATANASWEIIVF
jgi:hypothetical protein